MSNFPKCFWPWTLWTAFGPIEEGSADDPWRPLWDGGDLARSFAEFRNGFSFGRHVFAAPVPEIGDPR